MCAVENVDLLISGGIVVTMDPQERIFPNGASGGSGFEIVPGWAPRRGRKDGSSQKGDRRQWHGDYARIGECAHPCGNDIVSGVSGRYSFETLVGKDLAAGTEICYCAKCGTGIKAGFC